MSRQAIKLYEKSVRDCRLTNLFLGLKAQYYLYMYLHFLARVNLLLVYTLYLALFNSYHVFGGEAKKSFRFVNFCKI